LHVDNNWPVSMIMSGPLVACLPTTPVDEVTRTFLEHDIQTLLVIDTEGYAVGVVAQADLLLALQFCTPGEIARTTAGDIMTADLVTCTQNMLIAEAIVLMLRNNANHLIVVKPYETPEEMRFHPIGVISMNDIIRHISETLTLVAADVCQSPGADGHSDIPRRRGKRFRAPQAI
jgi:CBS domain-containing protein